MIATLSELAALDGMPSEPTLRKMIAADPDFPGIVKRGSNGDAYEIEVEAAVQHILGIEERKREESRQRSAELRQFAMDLGLSSAADTGPAMTIADRKALLEEEFVATKLARLRGELVDKGSVVGAVSAVLVWHQQQSETFAARLAKRVDVDRALQTEIEKMMEADRAEFARRLRKIGQSGATDDGDGGDASSAALAPPAD